MALTLPANWKVAFDDENITPVFVLQIEVGVRAYFDLVSYAQGAGDTVTVEHTPSGGSLTTYVLTEGVAFDAETDDETTAANIAAALRAALPEGVLCYAQGTRVTISAPAGDTLAASTSDATAWAATAEGGTGLLSCCSGDRPVLGHPQILGHVQALAQEIDPVDRKLASQSGLLKIDIADNGTDDVLPLWASRYPDLRGSRATLWLGWQEATSLSDFVQVGSLRVERVIRKSEPAIELRLREAGQALSEAKITPSVINRHPLEALASLFDTAGLVDYSTAGLDPTTYSDIGHWVVSLHGYDDTYLPDNANPPLEPTPALELLNELLVVLDGSFLPDEGSEFVFKRHAIPATSADYGLTSDEYADFRQSDVGQIVDEVIVTGPVRFGASNVLVRLVNENTRHRAGTVGEPLRPRVLEVSSKWLGRVGGILGRPIDAVAGAGTTFEVYNAPRGGFAGTRAATAPTPGTAPSSWSQSTNTNATSSRLVYLLLVHAGLELREIVSCDAVESVSIPDAASGSWLVARYRLAERGLFGTSALRWPPASSNPVPEDEAFDNRTYVVDITDAVDVAQRKLTRLADGLPSVEFSTTLRRYGMQLGETVVFPEETRYLDDGFDGLVGASTGIFELVRKEVTPNGIAWKAALLNYDRRTPLRPVPVQPGFPVRFPTPSNLYSLELNGTDECVYTFPFQTTLDGVEYAAVVGWFRSVGAVPDARHLFFSDTQLEIEAGIPGTHTNRTEIRVTLNGGTYTATTTNGPIVEDQWYHLAVLFDGASGALQIYVSNRKATPSTSGSIPSTLTDRAGANRFLLGASSTSVNGSQWPGRLDEWAVFTSTAAAFDEDDVARWFNSGRPPNLALGPDHWWRFENELRDRRNVNGYLGRAGTPSFSGDVPVAWWLSQSGDFDGADDEVLYGSVATLDGAANATWSAWLYMPSLDVGTILARLGSTSGGFSLRTSGTGSDLVLEVPNGGTSASEASTGGPLSAATWHHVCAVFAAGTVTLYVDGAAVASSTTGTLPATVGAASPASDLQINDASSPLAARLSNPAFWTSAASAAQVAEIYNSGAPPDLEQLPTLGAPAWWVTADGVWAPRLGAGTAAPAGGVGFVADVPA